MIHDGAERARTLGRVRELCLPGVLEDAYAAVAPAALVRRAAAGSL